MEKKKLIGIALVIFIIGAVGFYSCEKTYVEPVPAQTNESDVLPLTVWRITSFQWKDRENNDHFISYTFQISNGVIEATHNHIKEYGKFIRKSDNTLQINFVADPLSELNNNWTIKEFTSTSISLKGLSPYDGSSEFLLFEKSSSTPPN